MAGFTILQFTSLLTTFASAVRIVNWQQTPSNGIYSINGFGAITTPSGSGVEYKGNIGEPYGSNIVEISASEAANFKYVVQFRGPESGTWTIVIWNKFGSGGELGGWFGKACKELSLTAGETRFMAFDENTQGGWAAAPGLTIPTDRFGGYASTWGEFDFGSFINSGRSGFDVSAIAAQNAELEVQGMKICDVLTQECSSINGLSAVATNAYTIENYQAGGIGGNVEPGPVRLAVDIGYEN